jgi:3-isopropylmalate/(R)-2-methylmalate dehydratase small subunit
MRQITTIEGRGLVLRGDDIDTDRIIPARFLRAITFEGMERHVFEDDRKAGGHPFDDPKFAGASVLVVNTNFGCGSSREHAPQAIQRWGIQAIVGQSFAEIFFGNSVMIGLPCLTASPEAVARMMEAIERNPQAAVRVDLPGGTCTVDGVAYAATVPANTRDALTTGAWDTTGILLDRFSEVEATARRLPYATGF